MSQKYKTLDCSISLEQNSKLGNIFDLKLANIKTLQNYHSVELSFFLYPYNRGLDADSFSVLPYEEYVNDLNQGSRSIYEKVDEYGGKVFGILLGVIIALVFLLVKPSDFISIQSIISILGAYTIGKEIWSDLHNFLISSTKNWTLKWRESQYYYSKQDFGTIQRFWRLARNQRYGNSMVLPSQFELVNHSNTKMIELKYDKNDLYLVTENDLQLASLEFVESNLEKLKSEGFMIGLKLTLTQKLWFLGYGTEFFQAQDLGKLGTVNPSGTWQADHILVKQVLGIGNLKYYLRSESVKDLELMKPFEL